ncbi:hypothetical protein EIN_021300 [Entamoeba invadens IP1]|uniref:hypothetical protein n=1 Tax=Entamoeba invadens IP1 TaxID=370355 RepID=UPI0002C3D505|nr:hypothetical protein EIN_021300 [Entamoeba invadens IP1]ELP90611.1 hypothetical protein EIN_021300 [Entamoeba invadens IP1]|eukprot:XP_004257382.1 hypothetical protein EIN_021300 [Entamoeba invadens IP1]
MLSSPPTYLPLNLKSLKMVGISNSLMNLSAAQFQRLSLRKCTIDSLTVPPTLTSFKSVLNSFKQLNLNCVATKAIFESSDMPPAVLIPTHCTQLKVRSLRILFMQLTELRRLELIDCDHSQLATTVKLSKLTALTFIAKSAGEFIREEEIPKLMFSSCLVDLKLQNVCFVRIGGRKVAKVDIEFLNGNVGEDSKVLTDTKDMKETPKSGIKRTDITPEFLFGEEVHEFHLKGLQTVKEVSADFLYVEGANELSIGKCFGLHLRNCRGKIGFENESQKKVGYVHLYNCVYDKTNFAVFKNITKMRVDVFGKFKENMWKFSQFTNLMNLTLFASQINLSKLDLPTTVTAVDVAAPKIISNFNNKQLRQIKLLSVV